MPSEDILRLYAPLLAWVYLFAWGMIAVWEWLAPGRPPTASLRTRWLSHAALFVGGAGFVNVLLPMTCVATAVWIAQQGWGLLNQWALPYWLGFLVCILAMDLGRYGAHFLEHRVPMLWRLHRVHHTDRDMDFTTSLRFHPLDLLYVTLCNMAVIAALGLPVEAVVVYEAAAFLINTFNHGNLHLAPHLDRWLRRFVVSPDMHRIHHSSRADEYDCNLGAMLPWWDHLFGTYRHQPAEGQAHMRLGLAAYRHRKHDHLHWLLVNPILLAAPSPRGSATPDDAMPAVKAS